LVKSGKKGEIDIPSNADIDRSGAGLTILGGRSKTLFVEPKLEGNYVHYTLKGLVTPSVASRGSPSVQMLRSDNARLGESQIVEERGLGNGRKQLAVLTFELEMQKASSPESKNNNAP